MTTIKTLLPTIRPRTGTYKYYALAAIAATCLTSLYVVSGVAEQKYKSLLSVTIFDRTGIPLSIKENDKGHYVYVLTALPDDFKNLLIQKEDSYFFYHPGINPFSTARALVGFVVHKDAGGASTITQQLTKNLLHTELERTIVNKLREAWYALSLELFYSKEEILIMYANTVYLGNQVQGFETGSYAYFNKPLAETSPSEQLALLATLSYPNARNPWEEDNTAYAEALAARIAPQKTFTAPEVTDNYSFQKDSFFELRTAGLTCSESCRTTIDESLTVEIRKILNRHISAEWERGARNGAVVVLDPHRSEILALVGSKNPNNLSGGDQINMALEPRPIGSTIKPLLYLKGFVDGLRPYSLVDDREYKYSIATGFPLYPKNFDGQYRGEVTLHEALSNSLNVPSVKVLEYIGLHNFYAFLSEKLKFQPLRDYDSYQYGIALGGLEMDLLTLTHYFTVFPNLGTIEPIRILIDDSNNFLLPPQSDIPKKQVVAEEKFVQLVHVIISDRLSGVNQFGLESSLNIEAEGYGLKTGTSRDFHDSWVIGYTGDFVVGVWIGNTENEPLKQVTGQSGAGAVWHDTMNLLLESDYNQETRLSKEALRLFPIANSNEWGLLDDEVALHQRLLLDTAKILSPHDGDSFEFFTGMTIPLKAAKDVTWSVQGENLGTYTTVEFRPKSSGSYEIIATDPTTSEREIIQVTIITQQ